MLSAPELLASDYENFKRLLSKPNTQIELRQGTYPLGQELGKGGSKIVYAVGEYAIFIGNSEALNPQIWRRLMKEECQVSDGIQAMGLGFETQQLEIQKIWGIDATTGKKFPMEVLVTKNFNALAQERNITIFDTKNSKSYGSAPVLYNNSFKLLADPDWNKALIQGALNQIILGISFEVPCHSDARNFYLANSLDGGKKLHLFLYDFSSKSCERDAFVGRTEATIPSDQDVERAIEDVVWAVIGMMSGDEILKIANSDPQFFSKMDLDDKTLKSCIAQMKYSDALVKNPDSKETEELRSKLKEVFILGYNKGALHNALSKFLMEVIDKNSLIEEARLFVENKNKDKEKKMNGNTSSSVSSTLSVEPAILFSQNAPQKIGKRKRKSADLLIVQGRNKEIEKLASLGSIKTKNLRYSARLKKPS